MTNIQQLPVNFKIINLGSAKKIFVGSSRTAGDRIYPSSTSKPNCFGVRIQHSGVRSQNNKVQ
ncbi:hypothetical protein BCD64_11705 [Nostoc sp. MBR 210]|nr:hypothetical protein BCD64_11705 [Nostoc sp. MBR 210]